MKILTTLKNIVIVFAVFCLLTAVIDYVRIKNAEEPIFCIKKYYPIGEKLTYRGLFYRADRTIKANVNESMNQSYDLHYTFLFKTLNINYEPEKNIEDIIFILDKNECENTFQEYLNIEGLTIYTNCINTIKVKNKGKKTNDLNEFLENDPIKINLVISKMSFMGMINTNIEKYNSKDSISNKPFTIYRCTDYEVLYITDVDYYNKDICMINSNS